MRRFVAFALFALLSACGQTPERRSDAERIKVPVTVVRQIQTHGADRIPGSVRPGVESIVEARLNGRIVKIPVKDGDRIVEGQLLVQLDDHEIRARYSQADASKKQAELDLQRFSKLPSGAVPQQALDAARSKLQISAASLEEAEAALGYTAIHAPYSGVVTRRIASEGDTALPGKPLLSIAKDGVYRFESDIPESLGASIELRQTIPVQISGMNEETAGVVSEISPASDVNSRTLHVKLDLAESLKVRSGQFGYLLVPVTARRVIRISPESLLSRGQLEEVFVVEQNRAMLRLVRTGSKSRDGVEILSGLSEGELLVLKPSNLHDGDSVEGVQ